MRILDQIQMMIEQTRDFVEFSLFMLVSGSSADSAWELFCRFLEVQLVSTTN